MRRYLVLAAAAAATVLLASPGEAYFQGPWCAGQGAGLSGWTENCSMPSFEACRREVVAGNRGVCFPNPYYAGYVDHGPRRVVKRKYRYYR